MRRAMFLLALAGLAGAASAADKPWRMEDERYSCYTSGMTLQELASGGVTVVSHTPPTREYCAEAHRWGLKVCPYVSLYKVTDSTKDPSVLQDPFFREVDASKHPEWFLRREDGEIRKPFDEPDYPVGYLQSCCNHRDLVAAYERGVRSVMAIGADGAFVDNVHPYPTCYGPKLGLHAHDWPENDNTECYKMALRGVYDAVKSFGRGRVVLLNSGGPDAAYVGYGDSLMWESFVWRFGFATDTDRPLKACRTDSWESVLLAHKRWQTQVAQGVSIAPLTYLPERNSEEENAFFAYACARLCGFDQWTATCNRRRDILRRLYRIRTGRPVSELVQQAPVAYRQFEAALVVCNPTGARVDAAVPLPPSLRPPLVELHDMQEVPVADGKVSLRLPPESGRIVVSRAGALDNLLREVAGQALAARLRIEEAAQQRGDPHLAEAVREKLRGVERRADALRRSVGRPGSLSASARDSLCALSAVLPQAADLGGGDGAEPKLLTSAPSLSRDAAARLLAQPKAARPTVKVEPGKVVLQSAGSVLRVEPEGRTLFSLGGRGFELWVAPPPRCASERWLHVLRLDVVKVTADRPDRKRVEGRVVLRGSATGTVVDGLHGEFAAEARAGSPLVDLELRIVNDGEAYTCYAFLAAGLPWETDPTKGTLAASEAPDHRKVDWVYLHQAREGGGGVLFTRLPAVGKSGNGSYVFGMPRDQRLEKGQAFDLSLTAATVQPSLAADPFLTERLENMARHASLAAGIAAGLFLQCVPDGDPEAGAALPVRLAAAGSGIGQVGRAQFGLLAGLDGREAKGVSCQPAGPLAGAASVPVPDGTPPRAGLDLFPCAAITLRSGKALVLRGFRTVELPEPFVVESRFALPPERPGDARVGLRLRSSLRRQASGTARLELPAGWQAAEARQEWTLPPAGSADVLFTLAGPGKANAMAQATLVLAGAVGSESRTPWVVKVSPSATAPLAAAAPAIDGVLDDPAWQTAGAISGLVRHQDGGPVQEPTTACVTHDDKALYVAVRCRESRVDLLRETAVVDATRNSPDVPRDDSVEVYVCPDMRAGEFVRFAVNCAGARKFEAHGDWTSAAKKGQGEWCVEMALPYAAIGAQPPHPGDAWGFNVCRNEQRLGESSCWSCTYGAYAQPDRFGWLLFR